MKKIWWQQSQHDTFAVGIIQELNDDLHVGGHEDFSVLFAEHLVHEDDAETLVVLEDPVGADAAHVDGVGLELGVLGL